MLGVMTRKLRESSESGFVEFVEEAPRQHQAQHLGLAAPVAIFTTKRRQVSSNMPAETSAGAVEAHQVVLVLHACHVVKVDDGLQGLALGEVVLELRHCAVGLGHAGAGC